MVEIFGEDGYCLHVLNVKDPPTIEYVLTTCGPRPSNCRFCSSTRVDRLTEETSYCRMCGRVFKNLEELNGN